MSEHKHRKIIWIDFTDDAEMWGSEQPAPPGATEYVRIDVAEQQKEGLQEIISRIRTKMAREGRRDITGWIDDMLAEQALTAPKGPVKE